MSTVAVFLPPSITESFEIVLARACDLQDRGESVTLVYCTGEIRGCVANPYGWSSLCRHCTRIAEEAIATLLPDSYKERYVRIVDGEQLQRAAIEAIENGPRSTILTFYRQDIKKINWTHKNSFFLRGLFKRLKKYEAFTYFYAKSLVARTRPKRVEFFNGRITPTMSIAQAAIDSGVAHCAIEVSGFNKSFFLAHNKKVHDLNFLKKRLKDYEPSSEALKVGEGFFQSRRQGLKTNDKAYTKNQSEGLFGDSTNNIVAVFLSSTDEFEIFGEDWFTSCSKDPVGFILDLRNSLDPVYQIVVRMHPNQAGDKTGISKNIICSLSGRNGIRLIKPADRHSSYELMDLACAVITLGSTIGFEATYWGKISILAGRCAWEGEEVAYMVSSARDAAVLITSDPKPLSKNKAVKVAAYYMDKLDETINLSFEHKESLFKAKGLNFLPHKRMSFAYKLNRAVDKFLIR